MLNGKTALITGGNSGIGLATAKRLRAEGVRIAITGTDAAKLEAARQEVGGDTLTISADVRSLADLKAMVQIVGHAFGKLDILFANAGVAYGTPIETTDEESFDRLMDINVKGVFFTVQAVLPIMADGGSIILNTSWLGQVGTPGRAVLSASKAAVRSFTRVLAAELVARKIRVNAVSPGPIDTPIHRAPGQTEEEFRAYADKVGSKVPAGRMGKPEEIAAAVAFLAGDDSRYLLGAEINVDGGFAEI
ncbi:NAD(P)-dependent dehydrogenase (short-subunit alcohol dehydrogenase family) [Bradyrhizobium sp. CIR18]|uniref:SDR family oxidoreductase n=1 Tax=Bradyrhizobium sp. CIR18 TaxID=2663839 RepID=UPI001605AB66|nr:SDR family oxidoreductase [Bradyrhizobium sp. CIR18]MBB4361713.1 NAD(P)-dependent dehydrogenase (short-subunit alcohol dehydrogenase family) [Bradyrhizobium sp. CIR18]